MSSDETELNIHEELKEKMPTNEVKQILKYYKTSEETLEVLKITSVVIAMIHVLNMQVKIHAELSVESRAVEWTLTIITNHKLNKKLAVTSISGGSGGLERLRDRTTDPGKMVDWITKLRLLLSGDVELNPGPPDSGDTKLISYNVRGLKDRLKLRHLLNHMQKEVGTRNNFICALQETYLENDNFLSYLWRGNYYLTPGNGHSSGCLTLLSHHLNVAAAKDVDQRGHILAIQRAGDVSVSLILVNLYAPNPNNNAKIDFFNNIFEALLEFSENYGCDNLLVAGDFNLILKANEALNRNFPAQEKRLADFLKTNISALNLKDIWDSKSEYTWKRANTDVMSTIDRLLYSKESYKHSSLNTANDKDALHDY